MGLLGKENSMNYLINVRGVGHDGRNLPLDVHVVVMSYVGPTEERYIRKGMNINAEIKKTN